LFFALLFLETISVSGQWVKKDLGTFAWLKSVYFLDEKQGWIVGSNGTVIKTRDGGETWVKQAKATNSNIRDVHFTDANSGWLLCERDRFESTSIESSYLLRTSNGGKTWERIEVPGGRNRMLRFVRSGTDLRFAVGEEGVIWRFEALSGGWSRFDTGVKFLLTAGTSHGPGKFIIVGGGGTLIRSDDGGGSWFVIESDISNRTKLTGISFIDDSTGCAVGNRGTVICSSDGGKTWNRKFVGSDVDLHDIALITENRLVAVGDRGQTFESMDRGTTWSIVRTDGESRLERLGNSGSRVFAIGLGVAFSRKLRN